MSIYGASRVLAVAGSEQLPRVSGRGETWSRSIEALRWREALRKAKRYICSTHRQTPFTRRAPPGVSHRAAGSEGGRLHDVSTEFLDALARVEKFDALVSVALLFGRECPAGCFSSTEMMGSRKRNSVLQEFAQQVGPAIYNVYLMRRLRERAGALERRGSRANFTMERFNR